MKMIDPPESFLAVWFAITSAAFFWALGFFKPPKAGRTPRHRWFVLLGCLAVPAVWLIAQVVVEVTSR